MNRVAGVDGCPGGWIAVLRDLVSLEVTHALLPDADALFELASTCDALALDLPMGLPARGARACDLEARRRLGAPRGRSVFPAPVRAALAARSHAEASRITERVDGRCVSVQAWNLFRRIGAVDERLTPVWQARIREVHPELSFAVWAGRALRHGKRTPAGRAEREARIDAAGDREARHVARAAFRVRDVAHDDLLDAFAALWTAERIRAGTASALPEGREVVDARGLRMAIWY